jgi:hypothetical protein
MAQGQLYASGTGGYIDAVEPETGIMTGGGIGPYLLDDSIVTLGGIAIDPQTGTMYASAELLSGPPSIHFLLSIDMSTGETTRLGNMGQEIAAMSFDDAGTLYAISKACLSACASSQPGTLFTVDKTDGSMSSVMSLRTNAVGGAIAYNSDDGFLYYLSGKDETLQFLKVDVTGPSVTEIPLSGMFRDGQASGFAYDADRDLFVGNLYEPDPGFGTYFSLTPAGYYNSISLGYDWWLDYTFVPPPAALEGRLPLTPGGTDYQAYYDPVLDITWAADANMAFRRNYDDAVTWVNSLSIGGVGNWRLPNVDLNGDMFAECYDSFSIFSGCRDNEFAYLYWMRGVTASNQAHFANIQSDGYWSQSDDTGDLAWLFFFDSGTSLTDFKTFGYFVWPVHDGDIEPFSALAYLPDINANDSPEMALLVPGASNHVHIRDGSTDELIGDIDFGTDPVYAMTVLADLNASGGPEIAVLNQQPSGQVRVQIRDSVTGTLVRNLWYGMLYAPVSMRALPDYDSSGYPEIAVMGSDSTDAIRVQVQDAVTGNFLDNVFLGNQGIGKDFVAVSDTSGNSIPELGILSVLKGNDQVRMQLWDAADATFQTNVWFGKVYQPQSMITMPDINANGSEEIVAIGVDPATQNIRVQVRDSASTITHYNIWLGNTNQAVDIALINDINGNGFADLAVLLKTPTGTGRVRVQDGLDGAFIRNLFYTVVENPTGLAVMPDYSGNGFDELAVLGESAGVRHVQILDTSSGSQVNRIDYPQ